MEIVGRFKVHQRRDLLEVDDDFFQRARNAQETQPDQGDSPASSELAVADGDDEGVGDGGPAESQLPCQKEVKHSLCFGGQATSRQVPYHINPPSFTPCACKGTCFPRSATYKNGVSYHHHSQHRQHSNYISQSTGRALTAQLKDVSAELLNPQSNAFST